MIKFSLPVVVLLGLMSASLGGLLLLPPIPQDQSYHQFADQRTIFGIPNFWNVVSNLPFLAVGAAGLRRFRHTPATIVFFLGVFLTGLGSSYYHWNPDDGTLFWDRLPMTLSFAAILALVVEERVNAWAGAILLWPALAIGVFSLLLWRSTGDLRLYFWVQFFPGLAVILLFVLYPPKYTGAYPSAGTGSQCKGNSQGTIKIVVNSTRTVKGTPSFTKSPNRYCPGPRTSVLTGDEMGVMNAAEDAKATVIANGWGEAPRWLAVLSAIGAISTAVAVLEIKRPIAAVRTNRLANSTCGLASPTRCNRPFTAKSTPPVRSKATANGMTPTISSKIFQLIDR